jgi:hypothetical protein
MSHVIKEVEEVVGHGSKCALQVGICSMSSILDYP